jgi:hypothetical protein
MYVLLYLQSHDVFQIGLLRFEHPHPPLRLKAAFRQTHIVKVKVKVKVKVVPVLN